MLIDCGKHKEAMIWLKLGSQKNDIFSINMPAEFYLRGIGAPQDFVNAFKWFSVGAETGDSHSQAMLSRMYAMGQRVAMDLKKARMWVNLAAVD